ncbi:CRISPR system precrRNA processing endoribonuclease RAMP protein Cas6 [bacterium]|nr:CRISPR system precrRNA processing endoribonuclease RAMP protein Cas6 [bacterium]
MLSALRIVELSCTIKFQQSTHFAFIGTTLRGGFGYVFRRVCNGLKVSQPDGTTHDVYSMIFDTPVPENSEIMRKYPFSPHPFVFSLIDNNHDSCSDEHHKRIKIIVVGNAIKYIPYFVYAIKELGIAGLGKHHIPFNLLSVTDSENTLLYEHDKWLNLDGYSIIDNNKIDNLSSTLQLKDNISLKFLTPCRIKYQGHFTDKIDFHVLVRNLLRRLSSLSYFHCGEHPDIDYKLLIEQASEVQTVESNFRWIDQSRYSTRQKRSMSLGGVVGSATYEGNIQPFIELLLWGELLHVGKGTSFGLGQIRLT